MQVKLAGRDAQAGVIRLAPGSNARFEARLVSVPERINLDGTTEWVPVAMLAPHRGRWVAQTGTTILLSGESFNEVTAGTRALGQLATVWRVPESREEAEMLPAIGR